MITEIDHRKIPRAFSLAFGGADLAVKNSAYKRTF